MSISAAINTDLIAWFAGLPAWQSEAFRRLLAKPALDGADYDQIFSCACIELGLAASGALPARLSDADLPTTTNAGGPPPQLVAVHSLTGVNMLHGQSRLEFGMGLTLIYGANGVGKSGYGRLFKQACRCHEKAAEAILPNVYEAPAPGATPTAQFEVNVGGATRTIEWKQGNSPDSVLRSFVVFDAKAARGYLTERNAVTVMPLVLAKFEKLGDTILVIKERLTAAAAKEQPSLSALQAYVDTTPTGTLLGSLTAATPKSMIEEALAWTADDQSKLDDLAQQETKLKTDGPLALQQHLKLRRSRLRTLKTRLQEAEQLVSAERVAAIRAQQELCAQLKAQKDTAAKLALEGSLIPGVGSGPWETLMRAAAAYFSTEVEPNAPFPGTAGKSHCALCQQVLSPDAHERLTRFWKFLQQDAAQQLSAAEQRLHLLLTAISGPVATIPADLSALGPELAKDYPTIWAKVPEHLAAIAQRRDAITCAAATDDWVAIPTEPLPLSAMCAEQEPALQASEAALGDPTKAGEELSKLSTQVRALESRRRATAAREAILDHHARLCRAARLREASEEVSTASISQRSTALQKKHVTKAFTAAVQACAAELGVRRAVPSIAAQTDYGRVTQSIVIDGAKIQGVSPDRVFSEGEQTALALAYFFAEHGSTAATGALIFDDPVNSLGHRIRAKVVEKIVALAASRQCMVFTHDLSFYCGLKDVATRAGVALALRSFEATNQVAGVVREGEPFDAMSVTEREKLLDGIIKEAQQKEQSGDVAGLEAATARFYGKLRSTWERVVEELLFNKVVMRFDEAIKTQSLTGAVVNEAIISTVFAAMTKCSGHIDGHDHAVGANVVQPDTVEMRKDLEALRAFRGEHKKKINAQEAALKHLKA